MAGSGIDTFGGKLGELLQSLLGGAGGFFKSIFSIFGYHKGGLVGGSGSYAGGIQRSVSAIGAVQRYHTGGIVGALKKGERHIVANDDEAVMPTVRLPDGSFGVKAVGGGAGGGGGGNTFIAQPTVSVTIEGGAKSDPAANQELASMAAKAAQNMIRKEMSDFVLKHMGNGGAFNQKAFT